MLDWLRHKFKNLLQDETYKNTSSPPQVNSAPANTDEKVLDEIRAIHQGGGFGSIIGRNSFQRKRPEALRLLGTVMNIYAGRQA